MRNIYVIRPFGFNIGNHVIYEGLKGLITSSFDEPINLISIPATNKYNSYGKAGLTAESIYEINQYGDGVVIGGGNVLENGEILVDESALKALRPPMMIIGVSWGNIYDGFGQLVPRTDSLSDSKTKALIDASEVVMVRDAATKSHLESLTPKRIEVASCPSLFIKPIEYPKSVSKDVLLSIRHPALMSISPFHQSRVRHDIRILHDFVRSTGFELKLLCHDHRDISFASSFPECEYSYSEDVQDFLRNVNNAQSLITYRLHSFLPAIVLGTHAVNISYDQRASSTLQTLGLADWDVEYMLLDDPIATVMDRLLNRDALSKILDSNQSRLDELKTSQATGMNEFVGQVKTYGAKLQVRKF